eukprot:UN21150
MRSTTHSSNHFFISLPVVLVVIHALTAYSSNHVDCQRHSHPLAFFSFMYWNLIFMQRWIFDYFVPRSFILFIHAPNILKRTFIT